MKNYLISEAIGDIAGSVLFHKACGEEMLGGKGSSSYLCH